MTLTPAPFSVEPATNAPKAPSGPTTPAPFLLVSSTVTSSPSKGYATPTDSSSTNHHMSEPFTGQASSVSSVPSDLAGDTTSSSAFGLSEPSDYPSGSAIPSTFPTDFPTQTDLMAFAPPTGNHQSEGRSPSMEPSSYSSESSMPSVGPNESSLPSGLSVSDVPSVLSSVAPSSLPRGSFTPSSPAPSGNLGLSVSPSARPSYLPSGNSFPSSKPSRQDDLNSPTSPLAPTPGFPPCSICGEGLEITLPDVQVDTPRYGRSTCATLQQAGLDGLIAPSLCPMFPILTRDCGCSPITTTSARLVAAPSAVPSSAPTGGYPACDVCGVGREISLPNVSVYVPTFGVTTCQDIQRFGQGGLVEAKICPVVSQLITKTCACALTTTAPVTLAPSTTGTSATTPPPTARPTSLGAPIPPTPPSPGFPPCNVCGGGLEVTLPNVILDIPSFGPVRCDFFQSYGVLGFIDPQFCPLVAPLAAPCGCSQISPTSEPIPVQTPSPTPRPIARPISINAPIPPTSPEFPPCIVCGDGLEVTLPDVVVVIPTVGPLTCWMLQRNGVLGFIDPQFCPLVAFFTEPCGCSPISAQTPQPSQSLAPTVFVPGERCSNAKLITFGVHSGSTTGLTSDLLGRTLCSVTISSPGVWHRLVGTGGELTVHTQNPATNFDTVIAVFRGDCDNLECVGWADSEWTRDNGLEKKFYQLGFSGRS